MNEKNITKITREILIGKLSKSNFDIDKACDCEFTKNLNWDYREYESASRRAFIILDSWKIQKNKGEFIPPTTRDEFERYIDHLLARSSFQNAFSQYISGLHGNEKKELMSIMNDANATLRNIGFDKEAQKNESKMSCYEVK